MPKATLTLLAAAALALGGCRKRDLAREGAFEVHDAWVRATPDTGATTAAYMRFVNGTDDRVDVARFATDAARSVELHQSRTDSTGAVHMTMEQGATLAPHATLVMHPGGYHLMLIGTTRPLSPGELVRITMRLSNGAIVSTTARVR